MVSVSTRTKDDFETYICQRLNLFDVSAKCLVQTMARPPEKVFYSE